MKEKKTISKKLQGFTRNEKLDKYADKVLFKDKVKMANQILKNSMTSKSLEIYQSNNSTTLQLLIK